MSEQYTEGDLGSSLEAPVDTRFNTEAAAPVAEKDHYSLLKFNRTALMIAGGVVAVMTFIGVVAALTSGPKKEEAAKNDANVAVYNVSSLPFSGISEIPLALGQADRLTINGQLQVDGGFVLGATEAPEEAMLGQFYFDQATKEPYFYNGTAFVSLVQTIPQGVSSIGGANGVLGLGNGLQIVNGQLRLTDAVLQGATAPEATGGLVSSVQGQTGDVSFTGGNGIAFNGTTITNTGLLSLGGAAGNVGLGRGLVVQGGALRSTVSLTAGSANLIIADDGNGNYTITDNGSGSTQIVLGPAVAQTDTTGNTTINVNKTSAGNFLRLASSGVDRFVVDQTGTITSGSIAYTQVTGAPATTVTSLGGVSGAIALGSGLNLASGTLSNSGVLAVNGTTNQVNSSTLNGVVTLTLPQAIATNSNPTFNNLTLNGAATVAGSTTLNGGAAVSGTVTINTTGTGTTSIGNSSGSVTVGSLGSGVVTSGVGGLLSSGAVDRNNATYFNTALSSANGGTGVNGATAANGSLLIGNGTGYTLANLTQGSGISITNGAGAITVAVDSTICTTSGNCAGSGGGVTTAGGTVGTIALFTGTQAIGNSVLSQSGSIVSVAGTLTASAALQGNTLSIGGGAFAVNATGAITAATGITSSGTVTLSSLNAAGVVKNSATGVLSTGTVSLGAETTGNYVATLGTLTGLTTTGNTGAGSTPTLSVTYGSTANTAAQGNTAFTFTPASGNLTGSLSGTAGAGFTSTTLSVVSNPTFAGLVTVNGGLTVANATTFTNAGATLNTAVNITNLVTGGTIGTAAATVDSATTFNVNQTTASQTLILPNPTTLTAGRIAYINNVGTAGFTMSGNSIPSGQSTAFQWNGANWIASNNPVAGTGLTQVGNILNSAAATSVVNDTNITGSIAGNILTLGYTGTLSVARGGTGSNTAAGARTNLGAAASGANNDITSLSAATSVGSTGAGLTLQGNASSVFAATAGTFTTTVGFAAPTANVSYQFQAAAAGTYSICTTTGNCAGTGGGVTTAGGTAGRIAKFTGAQTLADSLLSESGTTVSVGGVLAANTIAPTAALLLGVTSQNVTMQGAAVAISSTSGTFTNTLNFATPAGSSKTVTLPNASGTIAISASGPLAIDANGNVSCATCATSGGGATGAVDSLNAINGAVILQGTANQIIVTNNAGTKTITVSTPQDINTSSSPTFSSATLTNTLSVTNAVTAGSLSTGGTLTVTGAASAASFNGLNLTANATGFTVAGGTAVRTVTVTSNVTLNQDLSTTSAPTYAGLTLGTALSVASGGTGVNGSTAANGSLLIGNGTGYTPAGLTQGAGISITNGAGSISVAVDNTICTTSGNCAGAGTGVTTAGGTIGTIALFTGSQAIGNSILTQAGTTLTVGGGLSVTGAASINNDLTVNGGFRTGYSSTASGTLSGFVAGNPIARLNGLTPTSFNGYVYKVSVGERGAANVEAHFGHTTGGATNGDGTLNKLREYGSGNYTITAKKDATTDDRIEFYLSSAPGIPGDTVVRVDVFQNDDSVQFAPSNILINPGATALTTAVDNTIATGNASYSGTLTVTGASSFNSTIAVNAGTGIVATFSGRVSGADAVANNEFATLGQVNGAVSGAAGNYIANGTATQTANFNIQSAAASSVGGIIRGAVAQTADLLQLQASTGSVVAKIDSAGNITSGQNIYVGTGGARVFSPNNDGSLRLASGAGQNTLIVESGSVRFTNAGSFQQINNSVNGLAPSGYQVNFTSGDITHPSSYGLQVQNNNGVTTFNVNPHGSTTISNFAATDTNLILKGAAGQTADLFQLQNSAGTPLAKFTNTGLLDLTGVGCNVNSLLASDLAFSCSAAGGKIRSTSTNLTLSAGGAELNGIIIEGFFTPGAGQPLRFRPNSTGGQDIAQFQNSAGTAVSRFDANGNLIVSSAGNSSFAGNLGIGAATPGYKLEVAGDSYFNGSVGVGITPDINLGRVRISSGALPALRLDANSGIAALNIGGTGELVVDAPGVTGGRLVVRDSGSVGIGIATPQERLNLVSDANVAVNMATTGIPTLATSTTGGSLAAGTYYYRITALDGAGGETIPSSEASITTTGTTSTVTVNFSQVPGVSSYRVYRGTTAGGQNTYYASVTSPFTDTGAAGTAGTTPTVTTAYVNKITANGNSFFNGGNVGIGTTAAAYKLDIQGGTGIVGQFSGRVIGADAVSNNEFATLGQVNSLGAGNYINNQSAADQTANFRISGTGQAANFNATGNIQTNGTTRISSAGAGTFTSLTAGTSGLTVNSSGFAGLGTSASSDSKLRVSAGGSANSLFLANGGTGSLIQFGVLGGTTYANFDSKANYTSNGTNNSFLALVAPTIATDTPGAAFYYTVAAVNAQGETTMGNAVGTTTSSAYIFWNVSPGATSYKIFRNSVNDFTTGSLLRITVGSADNTYCSSVSCGFVDNGAATAAGLPLTAVTGTKLTIQGWAAQGNNDAFVVNNSSGTSVLGANSNYGYANTFVVGGGFNVNNTRLTLRTGGGSTTGAIIQGAASQSADLLNFRTDGGVTLSRFNASGQLILGNQVGATGQVTFFDGVTNSVTATLAPASGGLTANRTLTIPDENGTLCLQGSTACGFAPASGSTSYIQNGTTLQTANFNIQSSSSGSVGAVIRGAVGQTADMFQVQNSTGTSLVSVDNTGRLFVGQASFTADVEAINTTSLNVATGGNGGNGGSNNARLFVRQESASASAVTIKTFSSSPSSSSAFQIRTSDNQLIVVAGNSTSNLQLRAFNGQTSSLLRQEARNGEILSATDSNANLTTYGTNNNFLALTTPAVPTLATATTGGTLAAATYYYVLTATNAQGETIKSATASVTTTGATSTVTVNWSQVNGATGYKLYRNTADAFTAGSLLLTTITNGNTAAYIDIGAATAAGLPPTAPTGTGLTVQGWGGQTQDLLQFQDSDGTSTARITSSGAIRAIGSLTIKNSGNSNAGTISVTGGGGLVFNAGGNAGNPGISFTGGRSNVMISGVNSDRVALTLQGSQPTATALSGTNSANIADFLGGKGGNTTGTTGQVAGTGGGFSLVTGAGGDAPAGSTNGNGGDITLQGGAPGSGLGTAGSYGNILLQSTGGRVGLGLAAPTTTFSLGSTAVQSFDNGSGTPDVYLSRSGAGTLTLKARNDGANGNVISTFEVGGNQSAANNPDGRIRLNTSNGASAGSGSLILESRRADNPRIYSAGNGNILIDGYNPGATGISINSQSGRFTGIGTSNASSFLTIQGTQPATVATNGTNATSLFDTTGATGGNTTGSTGQLGGVGGGISLAAGAGGSAPAGSTNGNGGNINLQGGAPGAGLGLAGAYGNILLQQSGGFIGVGTASPQEQLHVTDTIRADNEFKAGENGSASDAQYTFINDGGTGLFSPSLSTLGLSTAGQTRLYINNSGDIGIDTLNMNTGDLVVNRANAGSLGGTLSITNNAATTVGNRARLGFDLNFFDDRNNLANIDAVLSNVNGATDLRVSLWNGAADNEVLTVLSNGNVGIGDSTPESRLDIDDRTSILSGTTRAFKLLSEVNTTANSTATYLGADSLVVASPATGTTLSGEVIAVKGQTENAGLGLANTITGVLAQVGAGPGGAGDANAFRAYSPYTYSAGTIATAYGLRIDPQKQTGVTTGYGIYQNGSSDLNYFAGNVGIGTSTPIEKLNVYNGNLQVDYGNYKATSIAAPGAPTVAVNAVAGNLTGNKYYVVTFVTANGETNFGARSAVVAPSAQQVNISAIPVGLNGVVTQRKIYRGTTTTGPYKLVATIADNTTTTYTDNIADVALGADAKNLNTTGGLYIVNGNSLVKISTDVAVANTFIGLDVGNTNTTGRLNTATGYFALQGNTTGSFNVASGAYTLSLNTTGAYNSAFGYAALYSNTSGGDNAAYGVSSLTSNTTGYGNTASGAYSMESNSSGYLNAAFGFGALSANTTGYYNVGIGHNALNGNGTGFMNTAIGYDSDVTIGNLQNATAIGYSAKVSQSNSLVLGGTGVDAINVGIGTTAPADKLHLAGGTLRVENSGDIRSINLNQTSATTKRNAITFNQSSVEQFLVGTDLSVNNTRNFFIFDSVAASARLTINDAGNIGLGGVSNANAKLQVATATANDGIRLDGTSKYAALITNLASGSFNGLTQAGDQGLIFGGSAIDTASGFVIAPWKSNTSGIRLNDAGLVGIGAATTANTLTVGSSGDVLGSGALRLAASDSATNGGYTILSQNSVAGGNYGYLQSGDMNAYRNFSINPNGGKVGVGITAPDATLDVYARTVTQADMLFALRSDYLGTNNIKFKVNADGNVFSDSGVYTNPADLAETYINNDGAVAGEVVYFLDEKTVAKTTGVAQKGLAGIVSTKPGLLLNGVDGIPVALSGKVPTKVSVVNGAIRKGDYLTSAAGGVAQKATAAGPTLGIALQDADQNGTIEVFVNLAYYNPFDSNNIQAKTVSTEMLHVTGDVNIGMNLNVSGVTELTELKVKGSVSIAQNLTVVGLTSVSQITVNGKIISAGSAPQLAVGAAAGTSSLEQPAPAVTIEGTDTAGTVTITSGMTIAETGVLVELTFTEAYEAGTNFKVALTPTNATALDIRVFVEKTANGFRIVSRDKVTAASTYSFDYIVLGSKQVAKTP